MDKVDDALADIEREFIDRGYRILYRRPDDHFVVVYQLQRNGRKMGFRMTEQLAADVDPTKFVDQLEREWGAT